LINMAFTMACPNFKKGMKIAFGPLGVKRASMASTYNECLTRGRQPIVANSYTTWFTQLKRVKEKFRCWIN
jgi:hypothetical protein